MFSPTWMTRLFGTALALAAATVSAQEPLATRADIETHIRAVPAFSDDVDALLLSVPVVLESDPGGAAARLERALELAPDDALVVLHADKYCRSQMAAQSWCEQHEWPRRLAALQPDNGAPWLTIARRARERQDFDGALDALHEAIERPHYDALFGVNAARLYRAVQRLAPEGRGADAQVATEIAVGIAAAGMNAEADFIGVCNRPRELRHVHACRKLAVQMLHGARSLMGVSGALHYLRSVDDLSDGERASVQSIMREAERIAAFLESQGESWPDPRTATALMQGFGSLGEWRTLQRIAR